MGFIEKMMGVKPNAAADADAASADGKQEGTATPTQDGVQQAATTTQPTTYTPEELEQLLADKRKEWLSEYTAQQADYLESLPEAERLKAQGLTKDAEIASLRAELSRREIESKIIAKLDAEHLPVGLAQFIKYGTEESTLQSADSTIALFKDVLQQAVNERLRGKTPEGLGHAGNVQNHTTDIFCKALRGSSIVGGNM